MGEGCGLAGGRREPGLSTAQIEMRDCWEMGGRGLALLALLALKRKHTGSEWVQFIMIRMRVNDHAGGFATAFRLALLNLMGGGKAAAGVLADSHLAGLAWAAC